MTTLTAQLTSKIATNTATSPTDVDRAAREILARYPSIRVAARLLLEAPNLKARVWQFVQAVAIDPSERPALLKAVGFVPGKEIVRLVDDGQTPLMALETLRSRDDLTGYSSKNKYGVEFDEGLWFRSLFAKPATALEPNAQHSCFNKLRDLYRHDLKSGVPALGESSTFGSEGAGNREREESMARHRINSLPLMNRPPNSKGFFDSNIPVRGTPRPLIGIASIKDAEKDLEEIAVKVPQLRIYENSALSVARQAAPTAQALRPEEAILREIQRIGSSFIPERALRAFLVYERARSTHPNHTHADVMALPLRELNYVFGPLLQWMVTQLDESHALRHTILQALRTRTVSFQLMGALMHAFPMTRDNSGITALDEYVNLKPSLAVEGSLPFPLRHSSAEGVLLSKIELASIWVLGGVFVAGMSTEVEINEDLPLNPVSNVDHETFHFANLISARRSQPPTTQLTRLSVVLEMVKLTARAIEKIEQLEDPALRRMIGDQLFRMLHEGNAVTIETFVAKVKRYKQWNEDVTTFCRNNELEELQKNLGPSKADELYRKVGPWFDELVASEAMFVEETKTWRARASTTAARTPARDRWPLQGTPEI